MTYRPDKNSERGTVLLTTLLIMAVMAAITVALMDDIRLAVKRTINVNAYAQADWQARGAQDFIQAYLERDFATLPDVAKSVILMSSDPLVLPTQGGAVTVNLRDTSACFNLNSLVTAAGTADGNGRLQFLKLAELLGLPDTQSVALTAALTDWMDADQQQNVSGAEDGTYLRRDPPYRTADAPLTTAEELRAIDGISEDMWQLFKPYICTGGAGVLPLINVNTVTPERLILLVAALGGPEAVPLAESILRDRPLGGYTDFASIDALINRSNIDGVSTSRLSLTPTGVIAEIIITEGQAERARVLRYDGLDKGAPVLTYRGWGRAAFLPELPTEDDT